MPIENLVCKTLRSKYKRDDILSSFLSTKDYHTKGFVRYTIELFNSGNVVLYFWPADLDNFDFYLRCDFEEAWREMERIKRELLEKRKDLTGKYSLKNKFMPKYSYKLAYFNEKDEYELAKSLGYDNLLTYGRSDTPCTSMKSLILTAIQQLRNYTGGI